MNNVPLAIPGNVITNASKSLKLPAHQGTMAIPQVAWNADLALVQEPLKVTAQLVS